jgi:hypothetical protein
MEVFDVVEVPHRPPTHQRQTQKQHPYQKESSGSEIAPFPPVMVAAGVRQHPLVQVSLVA